MVIYYVHRIYVTEDSQTVSVLYIGKEQMKEAEILANTYGSDRYAKFIKLVNQRWVFIKFV